MRLLTGLVLALLSTRAAAAEPMIDVVVEGDPLAPAPADPTPSRYVVQGDELSDPGLDLADVLDRAPGTATARTGGSADPTFASLRGGRSAQTPVYLGSIRLNDDVTGQADLSSLPAWMLHRAEIYRGHAPRWVDELGIGGAIVLEPRLPRGSHASAAVGAGSFGSREGRASWSAGDDRAAALFSIGHRAAEGDFTFHDDGGTRFDTDDDVERRRVNGDHVETDAWAIGRLSSRRARVLTIAHAFSREAGAPGLQLPGARHSRVEVRRLLGGIAADLACAARGCRVEIDASYLGADYRLHDPLREIGPSRAIDNRGTRTTERLRLELRPHRSWAAGASLGHTRSTLALDADFAPVERALRHALRGALDGQWSPASGLDLVAVAALDCHTTRGSGDDGGACSILEPTARAGARQVLLELLEIFGNVGRYVRVPTLGEKYGTSATVLGNPALGVEKGYSVELGLRGRGPLGALAVYGEVVGFARFVDDLVALRRASLGAVRPYNVGAARILGLEVVAGARLSRWLSAELSMTFIDPRDTGETDRLESDRLPYVAPIAVVPSLEARSPRLDAIALETASLALRFRHQAARAADPAGLIVLPPQDLLDLSLALAFDQVTLRARLENLLDDRTFDLVGYPLPGRAAHGLVEVGW